MSTDSVWMTPVALEQLRAELAELTRNTDPHHADRIRHLRELIDHAETELKPDDGLVEPGMRITIRFARDDNPLTFLFGARELLTLDDNLDLDVYSPSSPLGAAINGHYVNDTVTYDSPQGPERVTIVAAEPFA